LSLGEAIKEAGRSPCALYHRTQQKHEGTLEQLCQADSKNLLGCSHDLSEASRTMGKAKKPISAYIGSY